MKAIVYLNDGSPDVLKLEEIDKPTPGADEVLIKVRAASVNPIDSGSARHPFLRRILFAMSKSKV
ncbi:MAG: NAD(P)-dependent alcohol dehydrogenase, partial [Pyrinomonadaceae bacterium]